MNEEQRLKEYEQVTRQKSKYEQYTPEQRLADLKNVVDIQNSKGNFDQGEYMRGMANGLLLAWNIMGEPYGTEVIYKEAPWGS